MVALLVEIVGGPDDGERVEVEWLGPGVVWHRGHRYVWRTEDTGAPYLWYVGDTP